MPIVQDAFGGGGSNWICGYCLDELQGLITRAIAQVVSRRPLTAAAWARSQASTYGICNEQVTVVQGLPLEFRL